ncbi:MAG: hypothetical protein R2827_12205 [Bdellovibrionales bacterium]
MKSFMFLGSLPSSKSIYNRALIAKSYYPELEIQGRSDAEDVAAMIDSIDRLTKGENKFYCGHAGTVFRFLVPRLAREKGRFTIAGSRRLFERPQQAIEKILLQLGAFAIEWTEDSLSFSSDGWRQMGDAVHVSTSDSSQFLSGILLNAWQLPFDLAIVLPEKLVSVGYLQMTLDVLHQLGMDIRVGEKEITIPKNQKVVQQKIKIEPDMSCAFSIATVAALCGEARFTDFPDESLQPDGRFFDVLEDMGIQVEHRWKWSRVLKTKKFHGIDLDLGDVPDLFPMLAILCCFAQGRSHLHGAKHLAHKESNRIEKVCELLTHLMIRFTKNDDGIEIEGPVNQELVQKFEFDPDNDHRMAMAAALLQRVGLPVKIKNPDVVGKSFPDFYNIIGVTP